MTADDIARLAYLGLLGLAVVGWVVSEGRRNIGRFFRQLLVWCFIFLGAVGGFGLWQDIQRQSAPRQLVLDGGGRVEVPRAFDGHYYVTARVNGQPVDFVVDTGATDVVLTRQDASKLGLDPRSLRFDGRAGTANGTVRTARLRLDELSLGGVADRNVSAVVNAGEMETSLLGMAFLNRFSRIEITGGKLVLQR